MDTSGKLDTLTTASGNRARPVFTVAGENTAVAINWERHPSPADLQEYDRWFYRQHPELAGRKVSTRDMTGAGDEEIARRMLNFVETGRMSYPEEN